MSTPAGVRDRDRLGAVRRLGLLDGPGKLSFDRLTELAAGLLEAPIALMTLVDADRQFFVGSAGLPEPLRSARQTPLEYSLCQHALASGRPLVIPDARLDPTLAEVRAVIEYGVVSYAGAPTFSEGQTVGTLCVLDFQVRCWREDEIGVLQHLADIASGELKLHLLEQRELLHREWAGLGTSRSPTR